MQGATCTSCRAISRSRFHLRLFILKDGRRKLHTSPAQPPFQPQSWYWETKPPTQDNLEAATRFFQGHRPFREWTGMGWRKHNASPRGVLVPEVVFLGRSNVGKSSLLNHITGDGNLNRVSQTPGATKTMFAWSLAAKDPETGGALPGWGGDCKPKLTVIDMPGYGYGSDVEWGNEIMTYMKRRKELQRAYVVVDALQGITAHDRKILDVLRVLAIPYQIVVTKCDKSGWHTSQTAVESALRPLREEVELGRSTQAGLGELLLVGALQAASSTRPYGVENLRWSILRATGLDHYAMSKGPDRKSPKANVDTAGSSIESLAASQSQAVSPTVFEPLKKYPPPVEPVRKAELSLQDFLAELLNIKDAPKPSWQKAASPRFPTSSVSTSAQSDSGGRESSRSLLERFRAENPIDQTLFKTFAASQSPHKVSEPTSNMSPPEFYTATRTTTKSAPRPTLSPSAPMRSPATKAVPQPTLAPPTSTRSPATKSGKGVIRGLDAFESMFNTQESGQRKGSRAKPTKSSTRSHPTKPTAPVPVMAGKGVTRGLDAFESMFASGDGGKKKRKRW